LVVVTERPDLCTVTGARGRFRFDGVPVGFYTLSVWHPAGELSAFVYVDGDQPVRLEQAVAFRAASGVAHPGATNPGAWIGSPIWTGKQPLQLPPVQIPFVQAQRIEWKLELPPLPVLPAPIDIEPAKR
jgi:hypothetical protein